MEKTDAYEHIDFSEMEAQISAILDEKEDKAVKAYINLYGKPKVATEKSEHK